MSLNLDTIKDCLDQIKENVSETAEQLSEIKGVLKFQASVLCNAVEGRTFKNKNQLIAFFGLDIKKKNDTLRGREKFSKRENSFYQIILFQLGWSLAKNNEQFEAYYQRLRNYGKHYYTCLITTARKFLRFFFTHFLKKILILILKFYNFKKKKKGNSFPLFEFLVFYIIAVINY